MLNQAELEETVEIPIRLDIHKIKHIIDWFNTHTSNVGTTDCEDEIAETLGNAIGNFQNYGFLVISD